MPYRRSTVLPSPSLAIRDRRGVRGTVGLAGLVLGFVVFAMLLGVSQVSASGRRDSGQSDLDLTLRSGILLALRNNRALVNARLDRMVEQLALQVAENEFRPHVTAGPYLDRRHSALSAGTTAAGIGTRMTLRMPTGATLGVDWRVAGEDGDTRSRERFANELEFTFEQPLLRGAGVEVNTAAIKISRHADAVNILALRQTVTDVISSVIRRYRAYGRAARRVDIRSKSLERARELLAVNKLLVRTGRMAERDIVQAQADIGGRELQLIAARSRLDAARLALVEILGIDSRTRLRLTDTLHGRNTAHAELTNMKAVRGVEAALRHRPDYLGALLGIRIAENRVAVAESERQWDLSVTLSARFRHAHETLGGAAGRLDNTDYGIRLALGIPIGPAAVDPAERAHAQANIALRKARNNLADLRQRIDIEVANAVREVQISARQADLARNTRELVEQKLEVEEEKLRLGLSSNFQLVAFENDLVEAQNRELDSILAHLDAVTSLDRTLGTTLGSWNIELESVSRAPER